MFEYRLLKDHFGIMLIGSYANLKLLDDVIREVNEKSPIVREKDGHLISLAYLVRQAHQGAEQTFSPDAHCHGRGLTYGFEIQWPLVLMQCKQLRDSLGFIASNKMMQSVTYALEYALEKAVIESFGVNAPKILNAWSGVTTTTHSFEQMIDSRVYAYLMRDKDTRAKDFSAILDSLIPNWGFFYEGSPKLTSSLALSEADFERYDQMPWPEH